MFKSVLNGGNVDSYTTLHIPMHGDDSGTAFYDASPNHAAVSRVAGYAAGEAVITKTAQSIFKGSSAYFPNATMYYTPPYYGCYLSVPDSDNWTMGTGLFTVDFWMRCSSLAQQEGIFSTGTDVGGNNAWMLFRMMVGGAFRLSYNYLDIHSYTINFTAFTFTVDTWYHIALIRGWGGNANDFMVTVNGTAVGTAVTQALFNWENYSNPLRVGQAFVNNNWNMSFYGYMSNFRISKGVARWTANFSISRPWGRGLVS